MIEIKELTCIPMFSEAQGVPRIQADLLTGNRNWARANVEAKFNATVHQTERQKVTSTSVLVIVQNQTWRDIDKYNASYIYGNYVH